MITGDRIQRLVIRQTVAPTAEPLTLEEAKGQARVDEGDEDALLGRLISAARELVESHTRRQVMMATWRLTLDRFPVGLLNDPTSPAIEGHDLILPRPNLLAVTSITYVDAAGVTQTMDAADYVVGTDETPGRISLAYNASWPTTRAQAGAVVVTYRAGYYDSTPGEDESDEEEAARLAAALAAVPARIKQAMALLVAHWFENREAVLVGTISGPIAFTVDALLAPLTVQEVW